MRRSIVGAFLFTMALLMAGCPTPDTSNRTFTSADTGQSRFPGGLDAEGEGAPTLDDGGDQREVVEPDVIRRQDNLLYVLNQYRGLTIVDLDTDTLLAQVPTVGYPRDLYFAGGRAYVLVSYVQDATPQGSDFAPHSRLYAVDVSVPTEATIQSSIDLEGDLVDSRVVGDVLYAVTVSYAYHYGFYEDIATAGNIASTSVTSINIARPDSMAVADTAVFGNSGTVVHVTPEFAFVASPDGRTNRTTIACIDITDAGGAMREVGAVDVRGSVDDKFKLDAWNGTLRVVANTWQGERQVYLSTYDLTQASLPRLAEMRLAGAEGETLFATRFDGPRAYIVTFLVVDPLFVVDVADPAAPRLLGALEVPGYSTYIQPQGDRLVALGVDNTNGQRVTVSLFDVSGDTAPSLIDRVFFGEAWAWSNAHHDVQALTILDDVIIAPFSGWSGYAGGYERLQFISYTPDDLHLHGALDLSGTILRSFDYGGHYYGVTTEQVTRIDGSDLDAPIALSSVTIAENLVDYLPLEANLGVEIVSRYDEGELLLRTVNGAGSPQGELVYEGGEFFGAYVSGNTVAVVSVVWDDAPSYLVAIVDVSDPAAPLLRHQVPVEVAPYDYYHYYDYGFGGPERGAELDGVAADIAIGFPVPSARDQAGFLLGDSLALRCFATRFDTILGGDAANEGLAVLDLRTGDWISTIGFGYDYLVSLSAESGKLYASTKESLNTFSFQRPMAAYYLREIDIVGRGEGLAVNVPGAFVSYDSMTDVLTLRDHQWTSSGALVRSLETVRWSGSPRVTPLDSQAIAGTAYGALAADGRIYVDSYERGYTLQQITVDGDGALTAGTPLSLAPGYGNLVGARGDTVYASLGYSSIAEISFREGQGVVDNLTPVSGYPSHLRLGVESAYFPLGYYGLVALPY